MSSEHCFWLSVREQFPALNRSEGGHRVVYLDNASSTQKPRAVLDAERHFNISMYANVHRGVYGLASEADAAYERAREIARRFLGASATEEIVFTSGTTGGLNLVAQSWGAQNLRPGDEILLTQIEHHANIVPWYMVAQRTGAVLRYIPMVPNGALDLEAAGKLLNSKTRVVAFTHVSNVLGTVNPVQELCRLARERGAISVVDGAQAVSHLSVNVRELGADFYAFGSHKVFGPTGVGVLYGRRALLRALPPLLGGGGMIDTVAFDKVTYAEPPARFEAGTPPISQAVGLGAALEFLMAIGLERAHRYTAVLAQHASAALAALPGVRVYGTTADKSPIFAFEVERVHPHDVATVLSGLGICVRAGHHCCMPLMEHLGVVALSRASFSLYNTEADIDSLVHGIRRVQELFR